MHKVLIIGAAGNLGRALAEVYAEANPILWDRSEIDVTDEDQCMKMISEAAPTLVYNCAAYNNVDKAEVEAEAADSLNGYAVGNLARACKQVGAILVHFSTHYVFDGTHPEGYNEDDKPTPISAYSRSKRLGEIELQQNTEDFYLVRTAWLYGSKSNTGKKSFVDIMLDLAAADKTIEGVEDEFGHPTHVSDLAQALVFLTEDKKPFGIYHITNSGTASWYDWAREIFRMKGIKAKLTPVSSDRLKRAAKRPKYGILNNTKFIELRPWTEALEEYLGK